jgi:hypothetical protein
VASLRALSLGSFVTNAASLGEYRAITCLVQSCIWQIDVHCRRGLEAALSGRNWTRGRAVLRSKAFGRCILAFDRRWLL